MRSVLKRALVFYLFVLGGISSALLGAGTVIAGQFAFDYHFLAGCAYLGAVVLIVGLVLSVVDAKLSGVY